MLGISSVENGGRMYERALRAYTDMFEMSRWILEHREGEPGRNRTVMGVAGRMGINLQRLEQRGRERFVERWEGRDAASRVKFARSIFQLEGLLFEFWWGMDYEVHQDIGDE